jgi:signal peptidase
MKTRSIRRSSALWRIPLLVFLSLVLGVNLYLWNAGKVVGNQLPMPFGCGAAVVLSGSMEPTLSVNDLVLIHQTQEIEPGDVVVYQSGNSLIIHRVISVDGETIVTQGDANNISDDPISMDVVKGKMILHIPAVGALARLLKTPAAILTLIVLSVLLIERSNHKERENDSEEIEKLKAEIRQLRDETQIEE